MQTKGELMFGLGLGELLIILFVVLMLFGGKRLPLLGSALGRSIQNFKNGLKNSTIEDETKK
jgi:sec-independent protein translocase protein TatA